VPDLVRRDVTADLSKFLHSFSNPQPWQFTEHAFGYIPLSHADERPRRTTINAVRPGQITSVLPATVGSGEGTRSAPTSRTLTVRQLPTARPARPVDRDRALIIGTTDGRLRSPGRNVEAKRLKFDSSEETFLMNLTIARVGA
jgi:hypothetical protein